MYTVYKITCLVNGKVYIGTTSLGAEERFKEHWHSQWSTKQNHRLIYQDMSDFGKDAFALETIESGLSPEEAADREDYWIKKLRNDGCVLYNKRGGGGAIHITEEQETEIIEMYKEGLGSRKIARIMNRDQRAVRDVLYRNKIEMRDGYQPKAILCVETGVIYESAHEVARQLGLNLGSISKCCNGQRKTVGGYHLRYV